MSIFLITKALEKHLDGMTPAVPTAKQNVQFDPPETLYQVLQIIPKNPEDPTLGKGYYRERVQLQVLIVGQTNTGVGEVLQRAELVRNRFQKGTFLLEGSIRIHVFETPAIKGVIGSDRVVCPVLIDVYGEVLT